ncbi:MAG: adenylate/guanylate cyclase domain-containing protein [Gammaproteobacteria bacterium]|nr:adenylate/guanylate cyclase domain-containing protein [Gammaproteobacteria bacterium]
MATNANSLKEETEVTILFADVVGSTRLYEVLGDDSARETVQRCVEIMKDATEYYGGSVIKTVGDEVMSTFPSADDAMNAGSQMQQRITNNDSLVDGDVRVSIRIGCHFGPVVVEDRDIFGAAVNTANRMTSQAKAGQIITTTVTVDQLSGEWRTLVRQIDSLPVRGLSSEEVGVFEVLWQPDEATSMLPAINVGRSTEATLERKLYLQLGGQQIVLGDGEKQSISLGRADDNDLVIKGKLISRVHALIELNKSHFMLVDSSTNGTFVLRNDGEEFYVRRDSEELSGAGIISLGKVAGASSNFAVHYEVR